MLSGSFGSQLILNAYLLDPKFYSGLIMGGPYFRHKDEDFLTKFNPIIDLIGFFLGHFRINMGYDTNQKPHVEHWDFDPKHLGMSISLHTL